MRGTKTKRKPLVVGRYLGFGDNIYMLPFVRHLCLRRRVYLLTAFPELFRERCPGIKYVKPETHLRTQRQNEELQPKSRYVAPPANADTVRFNYQPCFSNGTTIIDEFARTVSPGKFDYRLTARKEWVARGRKFLPKSEKPVAVVRVPTIRSEWPAYSRNPNQRVYQWIIDELKKDFTLVGIADTAKGAEWIDGHYEGFDHEYLKGEPTILGAAGMVHLAALTVAPPSFFLPLSIALGKPFFCVYGGFVHPRHLTDSRQDLSRYGFIAPEPFCHCVPNMSHRCLNGKRILKQKVISSLHQFLDGQDL